MHEHQLKHIIPWKGIQVIQNQKQNGIPKVTYSESNEPGAHQERIMCPSQLKMSYTCIAEITKCICIKVHQQIKNLDAGIAQATTSIKAYLNHAGHQGNVEIEARWNTQGYINFNTTASDGLLFIATKDVIYMYCGLNIINFYIPTTNASDDRLKGNEEFKENACETLSKLRPQLYDKKPDGK